MGWVQLTCGVIDHPLPSLEHKLLILLCFGVDFNDEVNTKQIIEGLHLRHEAFHRLLTPSVMQVRMVGISRMNHH